MLDLLVQGGLVVGPEAVGNWDIGVRDGKIVSLSTSEAPAADAAQTIDANGLLVVPGGIEPHAHLAHFISMRTESEMYTLGPEMNFRTESLDFPQNEQRRCLSCDMGSVRRESGPLYDGAPKTRNSLVGNGSRIDLSPASRWVLRPSRSAACSPPQSSLVPRSPGR